MRFLAKTPTYNVALLPLELQAGWGEGGWEEHDAARGRIKSSHAYE